MESDLLLKREMKWTPTYTHTHINCYNVFLFSKLNLSDGSETVAVTLLTYYFSRHLAMCLLQYISSKIK